MKCTAGINKYTVTEAPKDKTDCFKDDYVTKCIGAFGYWQALMCPIISAARFIVVWNIVSIVFLTPETTFACVRFSNGTDTSYVQNSTCYKDCVEYEYHNEVYEETLISKFGLICENAWLKSFTQTATMFGLLLGVSWLGWLSDRFGRRKTFLLATFISVVFMLALPFAPSYWIFTSLRFCVGIGLGGIMTLAVIVNIEMVGQKYRAVAGSFSILPDGLGQLLLSVIAYHTTTWYRLILVYGSLSVLLLLMLFAVPESPRWLVAQRRADEAIAMMTKVAKFNGLSTNHIKDTVDKAIVDMHSHQKELKNYHFVDLFRNGRLAKISVTNVVVWLCGGICFFGINHYSTLLGLNVFAVVPLMGLVQVIGPFIALPMNNFLGRKKSLILALSTVAASIATLIFIPDGHWGCTVTTGVGILFSIVFFCTVYTQSNELFPTPLRNMGVGFSSAGAKFGAMISPFIANTHPHWVASTIFAVVALIGAVCSLILPETKGKTLQDTIDD